MPWTVEYDYVETFTYNTETKSFDFHWRDDFETFDSKRWIVSDNTTFDANSTVFRSSQVTVKDGNLVLTMQPDEPTGHNYHELHTPIKETPVMSMQSPTPEHKHDGSEHHHQYPVPIVPPHPSLYYPSPHYPAALYGSYGFHHEPMVPPKDDASYENTAV